ncbi:hypothetical protein J6590_000767 [Homalodisca vitripennis]|nr:hypothetical protein J6590_000767 [Homalodisca vitripennis]
MELVFTALKAFHLFNSLAVDPHRSLTLSLATSGMELTDTIELRAESGLQRLPLPSLPTKVFVYATGAGCATVQGRVSFATYSPPKSNAVLEVSAVVEQEILPALQEMDGKLPILDIKACFSMRGDTRTLNRLYANDVTSAGVQVTCHESRRAVSGVQSWYPIYCLNTCSQGYPQVNVERMFVIVIY